MFEEVKAELVTQEQVALTRINDTSPAALIRIALEQKAPMDQLERLMALQERWEHNEARKAFMAAMAACKAELVPVVTRDAQVDYPSKKEGSGRVKYKYTSLANIVLHAFPCLAKHGLSYKHTVSQDEKTKKITVSCVTTHELGYSEEVTLSAYPDTQGNKNDIQALGSTIEFLRRYTLKAQLGIASGDDDDDAGAGAKTDAHASTPENRALQERAVKAIQGYETTWGIKQDQLEKYIGMPATEWGIEQFEALGKTWGQIIEAAPDSDPDVKIKRQDKAKEIFVDGVVK